MEKHYGSKKEMKADVRRERGDLEKGIQKKLAITENSGAKAKALSKKTKLMSQIKAQSAHSDHAQNMKDLLDRTKTSIPYGEKFGR